MELIREEDKNHSGFIHYMNVNDQLNQKDKREYIGRLTIEEKKNYDKFNTLLRQRKYLNNAENKRIAQEKKKDYIKELRTKEPEKMKEQNKKDVRNHRERNKEKEKELKEKEQRLKKEIEDLKIKKETKEIIGDILNDIIETIPKKAQQKKRNEAVAKHREKKKKGDITKKYNKKK